MSTIEIIQRRIRERLTSLGLSARAVSLTATGKAGALDNILNKGSNPPFERLEAIARALGTNTGYLTGSNNNPGVDLWQAVDGTSPVPSPSPMAKDIPIYASSVGESVHFGTGKKANPISKTAIHSQNVLEYFQRPPAHVVNRRLYGLYVAGSAMSPSLEAGSVIIVDGSRPPAMRDDVIVYLRDSETATESSTWPDPWDNGQTRQALIGRLLDATPEATSVQTLNPPATHVVPASAIADVHRIMTVRDLLGA